MLNWRSFRIDTVKVDAESVQIEGHLSCKTAKCPSCGQRSKSVHSWYKRRLQDLPISTRLVVVVVHVRRFRCYNKGCQRCTFAEKVDGFAPAWARRTDRLTDMLRQLGFSAGAESGSRLAKQLRMRASADTLLRVIRQTRMLPVSTPRVLGVDDWAWRRGKRYGTILVDLEARRPIELLPDRMADTLATWLRDHPGVEIISRDRSTEYMKGVSQGAPKAQQVADRWHLLKNWREALERMLNRLRPDLQQLAASSETSLLLRATLDSSKPSRQAAKRASRERRLAQYQAVRHLAAQGMAEIHIAHQLGLARATVRKFARSSTFPERATSRPRPSQLDPYWPYLQQRLAQGCANSSQLWHEIQAQGYQGGRDQVARWVQAHRRVPAPTTPRRYVPTLALTNAPCVCPHLTLSASRQLVWLLLKPTDDLLSEEAALFAHIRQHAAVDLAYHLTRQLQRMVHQRTADELPHWLPRCLNSGISDLQTFAASLEREVSSVRLALSTPWSNGPVEGHINRLKLLKRQMYGRANFDLLRLRVLAPFG